MVNALIQINEESNRVINIVKAKFGLKDKSEAINIMAQQYEEEILEPELKPEYKEKILKIMKGKHYSQEEFDKMVE
tara:strand:+ start:271 stop:498 length:228 start_codon:yes stop_codon:yes gene_type:complete